jgi:hypothetical protein
MNSLRSTRALVFLIFSLLLTAFTTDITLAQQANSKQGTNKSSGTNNSGQTQSPQHQATEQKPNSFDVKSDSSTIDQLVRVATNKDENLGNANYKTLARAGAIDALGQIGGVDQKTTDRIAKGLQQVLEMEYTTSFKYADGTAGGGASEFLCFHAVQAIGSLGWDGRGAIPTMQLLRGQNRILDAAIDHAIDSMQNPMPTSTSPMTTPMTTTPMTPPMTTTPMTTTPMTTTPMTTTPMTTPKQ